jgi:hypothetical protein
MEKQAEPTFLTPRDAAKLLNVTPSSQFRKTIPKSSKSSAVPHYKIAMKLQRRRLVWVMRLLTSTAAARFN